MCEQFHLIAEIITVQSISLMLLINGFFSHLDFHSRSVHRIVTLIHLKTEKVYVNGDDASLINLK